MRVRNTLTRATLLGLTALAFMSGVVMGQGTTPPAAPPAPSTPPAEDPSVAGNSNLEVSDVEAQMAKIESSGLDTAAQESLKGKFGTVIARLKVAETNRSSAAYFRDSLVVAPDEVVQIHKEIERLPSTANASKVDLTLGVEGLRKVIDATRAELADLTGQLDRASDELVRVRGRPVEIGARLPKARIELADAEARLKGLSAGSDESLSKIADQMAARAAKEVLASEVDMLTQEQLSQSVRETRRLAQRDLLQRKKENLSAYSAALDERLKHQMVVDTKDLETRISALPKPPGKEDEEWEARSQELKILADKLKSSGQGLDKINRNHRDLAKRRDSVSQNYQNIQDQVKLGAVDGSFSQVLMRQMRLLPNPRPLSKEIKAHENEVRQLMLESFQIDEKQREQSGLKKEHEGDASWQKLLAIRSELLSKLRKNYAELVRESARFETDERAYRNLIVEVRKYLSAQLFWQKSSPLIGSEVMRDIPAAVSWTFSPENLGDFAAALKSIPTRQPILTWMVALVVTVLLAFRPRLIHSVEHSGKRIRKISTDRYSHTLRALLYSVLLALPLPLVVGFIGHGILGDPKESDWVLGFGEGILWMTLFLLWVLIVLEFCRPGGLGEVHLNWRERSCKVLRRSAWWLIFTYGPLSLLASTMLYEESAKHFDSAGRLFIVLAHISMIIVAAFLFSPTKGLFSSELDESHQSWFWKLRWLWYPLLVGCPLALMVLAWMGYLWTALILSIEFQVTLRILLAGVVIYGLLVRWFTIRERRIALAEALEARRARRELAEKSEQETDTPDFLEVTEEELELDDVIAQTRRLLRVAVGIATVVAVWFLWSSTLPVDRETEVALSEKGFNWLSVTQLAVLIPISLSVIKNLPGLMDLAGLRSSGLESGTRYALTTLCQYLVTAVSLAVVFRILDLDWSQFGWIAAALSVGLGFGLQEVVANFVCGIIILFERPVRIGDVISLGEVTGTVTRIRMRATTITDWDRKDFIVPNKEFITGSLMNWTLSSPVNRLVIPVGVAYGSDTRVAREILMEIAESHELVLDEPKPAASFEAFADSTLNLTLRCYLPNMDNRLKVKTELCETINERFKEAGIEIAFPQQDIHLKGIDPSILALTKRESAPKA
ncbi:mechanosensitive ion channel domain-containing protein [Haloferula chungangensis]|uniref:Mechanosensitive ion channel domain-containing protein n=1 Tax=Haloferula chungangensis TaxID=1048331 RepID=A0ABW2L225_9BACT